MTDYDLMLEQLGGIHASASDLAALAAALRVTLVKLKYPVSLVVEDQAPAEDPLAADCATYTALDPTETQLRFMWGPHTVHMLNDRTVIVAE